MSVYKCRCESCDCPIHIEDEFDINDDRRCEECRMESETVGGDL